ncbi:MAG: response regulator [Chloroflexi bacterium]|nr:response regulator [Chloroflexota bacterium]
MKVLVAEDDRSTRLLLETTLLRWGYDVSTAANGSDAWEAIQGEDPPELVILDWMMPDMDGVEVCQKISETEGLTPPYVILLTSKGRREDIVEGLRAGADDYVTKPFDSEELRARVSVGERLLELQQQRLEQETAHYIEQLQHAQKMEGVGRLASGVAHDFNNLLTAIMGYSELLMKPERPQESVIRDIQEIKKIAQRGARLTQQLLSYSRRDALQSRVVSLNELVLDTNDMLRRVIGEDIELVVLLHQDIGLTNIDPSQFTQILVNLAVNARDAMPGLGKITVDTGELTVDDDENVGPEGIPNGSYVTLTVTDTGTGMSPEVQDRIFEPFFTTKEESRGTGLGLSTCSTILEQNNGFITVESELGKGTSFRIYLPRIDDIADVTTTVEDVHVSAFGTETLFLVEDEPSVLEMMTQTLRDHGYSVLEATNGVEAIQKAQEHADEEIHLLLTDVVMPLMGGMELATQMKEIHPETKVLLTSGYIDDNDALRTLYAEDGQFIQKPFTPDVLALKVREVLDHPPIPSTNRPKASQ